jgi:hypothetical protein
MGHPIRWLEGLMVSGICALSPAPNLPELSRTDRDLDHLANCSNACGLDFDGLKIPVQVSNSGQRRQAGCDRLATSPAAMATASLIGPGVDPSPNAGVFLLDLAQRI